MIIELDNFVTDDEGNEVHVTSSIASNDVLEVFENETDTEPRRVEFGDDGRARVPAAVGEYMAEEYDAVSIVKDEREAADGGEE